MVELQLSGSTVKRSSDAEYSGITLVYQGVSDKRAVQRIEEARKRFLQMRKSFSHPALDMESRKALVNSFVIPKREYAIHVHPFSDWLAEKVRKLREQAT